MLAPFWILTGCFTGIGFFVQRWDRGLGLGKRKIIFFSPLLPPLPISLLNRYSLGEYLFAPIIIVYKFKTFFIQL